MKTFIREILENQFIEEKQRLRSIVARLALYFNRRVVVFEYETEHPAVYNPHLTSETLYFSVEEGTKLFILYHNGR